MLGFAFKVLHHPAKTPSLLWINKVHLILSSVVSAHRQLTDMYVICKAEYLHHTVLF